MAHDCSTVVLHHLTIVMSPQDLHFSEEKAPVDATYDTNSTEPSSYFSSWFGGHGVSIGPRIGPVLASSSDASSGEDSSAILAKQRELENGNAIQYRTCSWQKVSNLIYLHGRR